MRLPSLLFFKTDPVAITLLVNSGSELIREPNLLIPGKKPLGQVVRNRRHPLSWKLSYFDICRANSQDLVSGNLAVDSGVVNDPSPEGQDMKLTNFADYQLHNHAMSLEHLTVSAKLEITGHETWGILVCVPHKNDATWTDPFFAFAFHHHNTTTNGRFTFYVSGASAVGAATTGGGYYLTDGKVHSYTVTRRGNTVRFYRDGSFYEETTTGGGSTEGPIDLSYGAPVHYGTRQYLNDGERVTGSYKNVAIWNRVLSDTEIYDYDRDPYQFLVPPV